MTELRNIVLDYRIIIANSTRIGREAVGSAGRRCYNALFGIDVLADSGGDYLCLAADSTFSFSLTLNLAGSAGNHYPVAPGMTLGRNVYDIIKELSANGALGCYCSAACAGRLNGNNFLGMSYLFDGLNAEYHSAIIAGDADIAFSLAGCVLGK